MIIVFKIIFFVQIISYSKAEWCIDIPSVPFTNFLGLGTYNFSIITNDRTICADECLTIGKAYSGVWKNQYCMCSDNPTSASNISLTNCTNADGIFVSVATFSEIAAVYDITPDSVQSSISTTAKVFTPTIYSVNPIGSTFGFKFSYKDRNDIWEYNGNLSPINRIFNIPGIYRIYAQAAKLINQMQISISSTEFIVYQPITNLNLTCQPLGIVYTLINCTLTLGTGSRVSGTISVDGTVLENIALPDFTWERMGSVPNYFSNEFIAGKSPSGTKIIGGMFQYSGTVNFIEINAKLASVAITILLLQPVCAQYYCPATAACATNPFCNRQLSCTEYCSLSLSCSNSCNNRLLNSQNITVLPVDYKVENSFSYTTSATVGYQIVTLTTPWSVKPGYRLGFYSSTAEVIATTISRTGEVMDFTSTTSTISTNTIFSAVSFTPLYAQHQFSAVAVPLRNIKFRFMLNITGLRSVSVNLQTLDNTVVTASSQTLIGLNINDTSFYYPAFALTNVSYTFLLNPHTGDLLQYYWTFGDNTTFNSSTKMVNHTYASSGTYNATVMVYNLATSKFQYFVVNVKDPVKIGYFNGTGVSNSNTNVNILLTMTSGTGFYCTLSGDGLTNITQSSTNLSFVPQWTNEGFYNLRIDCYNEMSRDFKTASQIVMNNITGLTFPVIGGAAGEANQLTFTWTTGSNITFYLMVNNITYDTTKNESARFGRSVNITVNNIGYIIGVLRATNLMSDLILVANLTFVQRIAGLQVTPSNIFANNGSTMNFTVTVTTGSAVLAVVSYGDGTNDTFQTQIMDYWTNKTFSHKFPNVGTYNVSVNGSNLFNNQVASAVVYVITNLGDYTVNTSSLFYKKGDKIQLSLIRITGVPALMANLTIDWNDGTVTTIAYTNFNETALYDHQYTANGYYNVSVTLQNPLSKVNKNVLLSIINPVINFRCNNVPPNTWNGNPITFQTFLDAGDNVILTLNPGDGTSALTKSTNITVLNSQNDLSHAYTTVNNYTANIYACNQLGCLNCSSFIQIQYKINSNDFQLTTNGNIELYKTNSVATLSFIGTNFPTNMYATFTYSGESAETPKYLSSGIMPFSFTKNISITGIGNLTLNLQNLANSVNLTATYGAFVKFSNFNVILTWGPTRASGFGANKNVFPLNQPVYFTPSPTSVGTVSYYTFMYVPIKNASGIYQCNVTLINGEFKFTFTQMGDVNVSFGAYNPIDKVFIDKVLTLGSSIQNTQIFTNPLTLKPKIFGYIYITWTVISTDACICVDFANGTKQIYGATKGCNNCTNYTYTNIQPVNSQLQLLAYFLQEGDYNIVVFIYNDYESVRVNTTLAVTAQPCSPPVVSMTYLDYMNSDNPQTEFRSRQILLSGLVVDIPCQKTKNNFKLWTATMIDPLYLTPIKTISLTSIQTKNNSQLIIPPRFLEYGLYKFVFTVVMDKNLTIFTFQASNYTYLKIVKSSIVVGLSSGGISLLVKGIQQDICFTPLLYSRDPDLDVQNFTGWTWSWTCHKQNETLNTSFIVNPKPKGYNYPNPKTGCFGDGPGTANLSNTPCFPGENFDVNSTYILSLVGTSPDQRTGNSKINIQAVNGIPPNITVQCLRQLMCRINEIGPYAFNEVMFNPSDSLLLSATCNDANLVPCSKGKWIIYAFIENTTSMFELNTSTTLKYMKGYESVQMSLDSSFFDAFVHVQRLQICYSSLGMNPDGQGCIQFFVYPLPRNIACVLDKTELLQTDTLCVNCTYKPGYQYRMFVNSSGTLTTLGFNTSGLFCSIIPYQTNNQTYLIRVTNSNGGFIDVTAGTVSVKQISNNEMDKILSSLSGGADANLTLAIAKGDFKEMSQVYLKYVSVISVSNQNTMKDLFGPLSNNTKTSLGGSGYDAVNVTGKTFTVDNLPPNIRDKFETARDSKSAILEVMTAGLNNMVPGDIQSLHLITSVVNSITDSLDSVNRISQFQVSTKLTQLAKNLKDLQNTATKDDIKAIATNILSANFESDTAANIQINNGIKRDIKYSKDNFLDYDTNLESQGKSYLNVDDPSKAANSLTTETNSIFQSKIASGIGSNSQNTIQTVSKVLRDASVLDEKPIELSSPHMQYFAVKSKTNDLSNQVYNKGRSQVGLPDLCKALQIPTANCSDPNKPVTIEIMATPNNVRSYLSNPNKNGLPIPVNSEVVSLNLFVGSQDSEQGTQPKGNQNFTVFIARDPVFPIKDFNFSEPDPKIAEPKIIPGTGTVFSGPLVFEQKLVVFTFVLTGKDQSIHFQIKSNFSTNCTQYLIVGRLGQPPVLTTSPDGTADATNFSFWGMIPTHTKFCNLPASSNEPDPFTFFVSNDDFNKSKKEVLSTMPDYSKTLDTVYFGVRELTTPEWNMYTSSNRPAVPYTISAQINNTFRVRIFSTGCYSNSNNFQGGWDTAGCYVGPLTTTARTHCICNHLTSFAGGWIEAPNTIDFNYVFSNFDFTKNMTLFITEIVVFLAFILIFIWARRQDLKDVEKVGVTPLASNDPNDMYLYEISVDTSIRNNSGTNSKVYFILSGEADETDARQLIDSKRKILQRGNVDRFLLAVPRSLGTLQYIRLWHDNSGKGKNASWYCNYFGVTDLQTKEKFHFLVNNWFAVEENDGQIDRLIAVASVEELQYFQEVFTRKMKLNLTEDHLWLSIMARPPESRFTRVERVACCLLLLFLTMLTTCMFYQQEGPSKSTNKLLTVGPFAITPREIWTGFISSIIAFVPLFLIIELFRKSQLKHGHANKLKQVVENQLQTTLGSSVNKAYQSSMATLVRNEESNSSRPTTPGYRNTDQINVEIPDYNPENPDQDLTDDQPEVVRKKLFPWWTRIIVWIFLIVVLIVAITFTTFYGIQFGDTACKKWISSMFISFFTSVLLTQPIKVILFAIFFSLVCKKSSTFGNVEYIDEEEDIMNELGKRNALMQNEEYLHGDLYTAPIRPHRAIVQPPPKEELEKARELRLKELQMYDVFREILFYVIFFCTLLFVTYSFRDPYAFDLKSELSRIFITPSNQDWQFLGITKEDQFWAWALNVLVPGLRAPVWYNNEPQLFQRGFISNRNNRLIGYAILRQVRAKKDSCKVYDYVKHLFKTCYSEYKIYSQDEGSYGKGWRDLMPNETADEAFYYKSESSLNGVPYIGRIGVYSGGGFVYEMRSNVSNLYNDISALRDNHWIDFQTRAIFVEFTTYNPNINLFAINTFVVELPGSGGMWSIYRVEPANLLGLYSGGVKAFEIFCQILYGIFILVIIVKEIRNIIKQKSKYFGQFWNMCEIFIIIGSFATVAGYAYVLIATNELTDKFEKYGGNIYLNFTKVAFWNENLGYLVSFIVFVATIKFIRILRFNRRIGMLGSVLSYSGKDMKQFFIIFTIMFLAFVMVFYSLFMDSLYRYHTFLFATEASIQIALGKFSFYELYQKEPIFGPIVFAGYVLFIIFVLLNMFIAILYDGFSRVKEDIELQGNDHELVKFIMTKFVMWTGISNTKIGKKFIKTGITDQVYKEMDSRNISGKVDEFPEKIEQLLKHINRIMYDDKKGYPSNENVFSSLIFDRSKKPPTDVYDNFEKSRPGTASSNILRSKPDPHMTPIDK